MANAEIIPMFSGDPETATNPNAITPSTFIKKFRAHMRDLTNMGDKERIDALLDYLVEDSPAEKWYKDLKAAFATRFPGPQKAERTTQEWERELAGMKLKVEELDTTVQVSGAPVFAHVHFASKLLETAKLVKIDATTSGIWQSRDALPEVIREKVPPTQANWKDYTDDIKAVDRVHIREGVAKAKKNQEMERIVRDLAARDKGRQPRPEPTTPVSKMSMQMSQAALTTPKSATSGVGANPFGAGGGRGTLFGQSPAAEMNEEGLAKLKTIVEKLGRSLLRDDVTGRAEYARRVSIWENTYAGSRPRLETTGYPLSPATVVPGSGECFSCGKITAPMHRSSDCPGPKVPWKESTFRSIVNKYLRVAPVPVNAVADWMDFGDTDEEDFGAGSTE
ncbi:hypothetical protein C8R45DRAFT_831845 [Mycena sanguinolenta]|nr:hypothetical protein C8R45DRAFT_831845 [Mycena sanguinolenta]